MSDLTLYVGNRVYSSWSIRGYLVMKYSGLNFNIIDIDLDQAGYGKRQIRDVLELSPTGCVPILQHKDLLIWDSLAIAEYINEIAPNANLYPKEAKARAFARALTCEMHSGFSSLRNNMAHNLKRRVKEQDWDEDTRFEIKRIEDIFTITRSDFGGKFLFGDTPGIVDAFYTPIASRLRTYNVTISDAAREYCETLLSHADWLEWEQSALEGWKPFNAGPWDTIYE